MWFKVRSCSSSGCTKWKFVSINETIAKYKESLVKYLEEDINAPTWSEHYRGIQYSKIAIEKIPREVIDRRIKDTEFSIECQKSSLKNLKEMASKCKVIEIKKKCNRCKGKMKIIIKNSKGEKTEHMCFICSGKDGFIKDYELY